MRQIGKGNAVVAVISEKYFKSENCMFEMLEIAGAGAFRERIFPIMIRDANLYEPIGRVGYVLGRSGFRSWTKVSRRFEAITWPTCRRI
jgi:hypothetical protein